MKSSPLVKPSMQIPALIPLRRSLVLGILIVQGITLARAQDAHPVESPDWSLSRLAPPRPDANLKAVIETAAARFKADEFVDLTAFARDLSPALPITPRDRAEQCLREAEAHRTAGRWRAALDATGQAIAADPTTDEAYMTRATIYADKALNNHAIAALNDGLAFHPDEPVLLGYRGLLKGFEHQEQAGLTDIMRALKLSGKHLETLYWLEQCGARLLLSSGNYQICLIGMDHLIADLGPTAAMLQARGEALLALRIFDRALADFESAATLDPTPDTINNRCWARLRGGQFAAALADFEQIRVADPTNVAVQCRYGLALLANGRGSEAVRHLESVRAAQPDDGLPLTVLGWAALLTGDISGGRTWLNQATEQAMNRLFIGASWGTMLTNRAMDAPLADFEDRCRRAPNLPFAVFYRAGIAARTNVAPRADWTLAVVCRFPRLVNTAPLLVFHIDAETLDQPWRPAAHLGEVVASACLLDRAKLWIAIRNMAEIWVAPRPIPRPDQLWTYRPG